MDIIGWIQCISFFLGMRGRLTSKMKFKKPNQSLTPAEWSQDEVTVGWVGHSTILINLFGYKILTDPVFGDQIGMSLGTFQFGIKRHTAPALTIDEIGVVDLILLSHAHMDHFDIPTLNKIANSQTKVITATGTSRLLKRLPFAQVMELGGTEKIDLDLGVTVQAVPVKHWGDRYPWNRNYGYTGYLIERNHTRIFFPGDTAYTTTFSLLKETGNIDLVFMPIGAYAPDTYQDNHCTPEHAWEMFQDIGAKWLVPIHWDTFILSGEPVDEPLQRLFQAAGAKKDRIVITEHGQIFSFQRAFVTSA
jgi:L-ascorbate metabolism protein UlaG (beta-lactamase superfamily)